MRREKEKKKENGTERKSELERAGRVREEQKRERE